MPGVRVFGYVPRAMSASDVVITLPDGSQKSVPAGTTIAEFVRTHIGPGLAKAALFARLDGADVDLARPLDRSATLAIFTAKNPESLELIRHDAAHVVASVVQRLFPGTQVTIGPSTDDGFYYDFARDKPFTPDDLAQIEQAANEEIKADRPFVRKEVTKEEALALFGGLGEKFKLEIIEDIFAKGATTLTLYSHGEWTDFCLGPHGPSTGKVGVLLVTSGPGATNAVTALTDALMFDYDAATVAPPVVDTGTQVASGTLPTAPGAEPEPVPGDSSPAPVPEDSPASRL